MAENRKQFTFAISLSVLNHLGRNLYRSFMTVLGEAISNSWDADANNVWVYIDKEQCYLVVKDDGTGMDAEDFQNKFLKIGYSKRIKSASSPNNRPYIGRKGIGKLALLSFADKISIMTRRSSDDAYVGGVIDNSDLDNAIASDLTPDMYPLGEIDGSLFAPYLEGHKHGTIIYFENINEGIRNSIDQIRKVIALYFRFSLIDDNFKIYVNDQLITLDDLNDLARNTQFLWNINDLDDPYISQKLAPPTLKELESIHTQGAIKGFIASVRKPRDLKIFTTEEKVGIDLFVNGRLREKDLLRHIPTARIYESYLYGQIHFDELDDGIDRFTSNREGIVADDPKFQELLTILQKEIIPQIADQWDEWRIKHREEGDSENGRLSPRERKSRDLFNIVSEDFSLPEDSMQKEKVDRWVEGLEKDAQFNFSSYAECFISENLLRSYIREKNITPDTQIKERINNLRSRERDNKEAGNVNIQIRQEDDDLSYLEMANLARIIEPERGNTNNLTIDAKAYKPIRDALAHTALLTREAKRKLTTVYDNIKGRVRTLLSNMREVSSCQESRK